MFKTIKKICGFIILSLILFSCASQQKAPVRADMAMNEPTAGFEAARLETSRTRVSENADDTRMVTYIVSLELSVKDPDKTREKLNEEVKNNNGFIVSVTEGSIVARIPSVNMDNYINNARTLGKVKNERKTGTDITDQYRDNIIRLENLRSVRNRYLTLLERAESVSDVLGIEKELERVNTQIEIMEGRIKHAELSVAYSSITVRFTEKPKPGPIGWVFYGLYHGIKWLFIWD